MFSQVKQQAWIDQIWAKVLTRKRAEKLLKSELEKGNITIREFKEVIKTIQTSLR